MASSSQQWGTLSIKLQESSWVSSAEATRTALDERRYVDISLRNNKKIKARNESVYVESLVYENFVLPQQDPLPTADNFIYIIHDNDNVHDNSASNISDASYDEYYQQVESNLPSGAVRDRGIRVAELEGQFNPYFREQKWQLHMTARYKININGVFAIHGQAAREKHHGQLQTEANCTHLHEGSKTEAYTSGAHCVGLLSWH